MAIQPKYVYGKPNPKYTGPEPAATGEVAADTNSALSDFSATDDDSYNDYERASELELESLAEGAGAQAFEGVFEDYMRESGYGDRFDSKVFNEWMRSDEGEEYRLSLYDGDGSYEFVIADPDTEDVEVNEDGMKKFLSREGSDFVEGYRNYQTLHYAAEPQDEIEEDEVAELEMDSMAGGKAGDAFKEYFSQYANHQEGEQIDDASFNQWMEGEYGDDGALLDLMDANGSYEFVRADPKTRDVGVDRDRMQAFIMKEGSRLINDYRSSKG